ncbi:type VI secretion system protein ImpL [Pseudomonas sp. SJZ079]|uniref:type VI secretion system protein n=1 Tax=Pseudomonas sp. SJZ079 TaxID=2572887 RepID=UPI00119A7C8B|nr:type VI secretion protein IcmF/TssM N-terminal domain-containing protein [Pseudomonas sp. SJZ079]TWC40129.1 type VI secretion system protein ImpL [Pseudomonas sp. SJZ079]
MSGLEITLLVLGLLVVLLLLAVLIWWLRRRVDGSARSCYLAVQQMERDLGLKDRYQTPWLMLLGDEQQSSELCRAWRLSSSGKPGWFGRWWYDSDAAVLAVPGAMFNHGEGALVQISAWWRLLRLLLMMRAGRPLDAVIWTLPAEQLWSTEQAAATGLRARRKFNEMLQRLGLSVPVYLVVTGLETVPGIKELADALPDEARDRIFGWSSPFAADTAWHPEWSEIALDQLVRMLSEEITELGVLSGKVEEALYLLPRQFDAIRSNLQVLCDPVFHGSTQGEAAQLRGIYFCAALAVPGADADPLTDVAELPREPLFVRRLLRQRVLAEQGLAQPVPRILHLRRRWQRVAGASAALLGLFWLVGMLWLWQVEREQADSLAGLLHELKTDHRSGLLSDDGARKSVSTAWTLLAEAPRWRFSSVILPSSLFSSLDRQLIQQLLDSVGQKLYQPLHAALQRNIAEVTIAGMEKRRRQTGDAASPEEWPSYVRAKELLNQAQALEKHSAQFNHMLLGSKSPLDDAAALSGDLLHLELNAQTLPLHARYNWLFARTPQALASPIELTGIRQQTGKHFVLLMRLWLDRLFADESFSSTAGQVRRHLQHLQNGQRNSILDLEELSLNIAQLRRLVAATNIAWSRSSGEDLAPGYSAMLEAARQSKLIGPAMVDQVLDHASLLQKVFHEQWLDDGEPQNSILRQQNGGSIDFQPSLTKLENAIDMLLNQDFAAAAMADDGQSHIGAPLIGIDGESLTAAMRYFASYRNYLEQGVAKVPYEYRGALTGSAQSSTAVTLWRLFTTLKPSTTANFNGALAFNVSAQDSSAVATEFQALGHQDMADALLQELNRRALKDLDNADAELQTLALYQPLHGDFSWWDGSKNAGLRAYRSATAQDMQQYLAGQIDLISDLHDRVVPALEWLQLNRRNLAAGNIEQLQRWQAMAVELQKYTEKNPSSAPALFERFANSLNAMELTTCHTTLGEVELPSGADAFSRRARDVAGQASERCTYLQEQTAAAAWNRLSTYFSQYLAGRFPFAFNLDAPDADPDRVRLFLQLLDKDLPQAQTGLAQSVSADAPAALAFLEQLQRARGWLDPLFQRDKDGIKGIDLDVRWRTDREAELGADQVIQWSLQAGSQQIGYPAEDDHRLRWTLGQPVKLLLRWAKNAAQKPADDPLQASLAVFEQEAGWEYAGAWALLRLLRTHVAFERVPTVDYSETPLAFRLPVYAPHNSDNYAQMFVRVALMNASGKSPLAIAPLPVKAPASPLFSPPASAAWPDSVSSAKPGTL